MEDLLLVGSSQAGDSAAFGSLIDRYYKSIYRFAFQYTGSHADADEVCQETFLRAFTNIKQLRDGSRFKGWIFMIASNLSRNRIKQIKREEALDAETSISSVDKLSANRNAGPFEKLSAEEKAIIVREQIQNMPEHLRAVIILALMEGVSQKEVAGILNYSEASVSRHLETARKILTSRLQNLI